MFKEIKFEDLKENPFTLGSELFLIAVKKEGRTNIMTAGWGGFGFMWKKPVVNVVVRPSRFTYPMIESESYFSLLFFGPEHQNVLTHCGKVSGRDEDKVKTLGLTLIEDELSPYVREAKTVIICKKMYADDFRMDKFTDFDASALYPDGNIHRMYFGEIIKVLEKS